MSVRQLRQAIGYHSAVAKGFTLAELLIGLALLGVLSTLSITVLTNQNSSATWARTAEDYLHSLASVYSQTMLKTGNPPVLASNGIAGILPAYETMATYTAGPPARITYPTGMVVYLYPEDATIPGLLADRGATPTILSPQNNREFLLLDMNGATAPNSLASGGTEC
jgi:prepilin-type N-terminal cleavage/methylation domain-containing protein